MKTSSAGAAGRPPSRSGALHCVLINQLATPGLGSLLARRYVAGTGQLILACGGFGLIMAWFVQLLTGVYRQFQNLPPAPASHPWFGKAGLLLFAAAWLWALASSLGILREARAAQPPPLPADQNAKPR